MTSPTACKSPKKSAEGIYVKAPSPKESYTLKVYITSPSEITFTCP
jgi:hypothetical protein